MSKQFELIFVLHVEGNIVAIFGVGGLGHLAIQFASRVLLILHRFSCYLENILHQDW